MCEDVILMGKCVDFVSIWMSVFTCVRYRVIGMALRGYLMCLPYAS